LGTMTLPGSGIRSTSRSSRQGVGVCAQRSARACSRMLS
jgi:hypothetical protein